MSVAKTPRKPKPAPVNPWPEKFKELRDKWGADGKPLLQKDAADKLGVTRRSWISWETGERTPSKPIQLLVTCLLAQAD